MFSFLARFKRPSDPAAPRRCPFGFDRLKKAAPGLNAPASAAVVPAAADGPLADALKARTAEAHTRAEKHPIQERMVKGLVTRGEYAAWLHRMLPIWEAVDASVGRLARSDARVAAIHQPYHPHAHRVADDLAFLGERPGAAMGAAAGVAEHVERLTGGPTPVAVLGVWYVLEGSANGGRFIAKALSRALNIPGPAGLTSFDPHGEAQRERWQAWRAAVNAQRFTPAEREAIVAAAVWTFEAIYDVMEDMAGTGVGPVSTPARGPRVAAGV